MAEVQKPVVIPEPSAPEAATGAPVAVDAPVIDTTTTTTAAPVPETTVDAPKADATEPTTAALATEEPKVEEAKPAEPITTGILGYKAPGLVKSLIFSKKHFWLGDEAVPVNSLSSYLRGEKGDVAHPTAAWSSQTGKGLLYFVKHAEDKKSPAGVLNLAEATDLSKDGTVEFSLKLHAHKHAFQAKTAADRDGWFVAVEKAIEEAKASAEGIRSSEGYKESLEKLNKPFGVVAGGAATTKEATPKKSTDVKPALDADRASSSSSSSDEDKKEKKKSKSKSRSASRKRASIFGGLMGKKDEVKEKKEEKKIEHEESKPVEKKDEVKPVEPELPVLAAQKDGAADTPAAAPVVPAEPATTEPAQGVAPVAEPVAESTDAKPKPAKRGSVFGSFFEKVRSPTAEKKEPELAPAVPPKDKEVAKDDTPVIAPLPVVEPAAPAPAAAETAPVVDTKPEEPKVEEPKANATPKEKKDFSFGKFFGTVKDKSKTPEKAAPKEEPSKVTETAPQIEEVPVSSTTAPIAPIAPATTAAPVEPVTEAKADETKPEETVTPTDAKEKRRSSFFGNLTSSVKKDKKTETETAEGSKDEKHPSKLSGLFRNPSKAVKSKKDKDAVAPKADETAEVKDDKVVAPAVEEPKVEEKPTETAPPKVIGDVVPEAVTVGQAQPSTTTPAVQASA